MSDEKFNDMAIRQFEEAIPGIHEYWAIGSKLSWTKSPLAQSCSLRELTLKLSCDNYTAVIFHSLPPSRYRLLHYIQNNRTVVWIGMGYDYYPLINNINCQGPLVLEKTKKLDKEIYSVRKFAKQILNKLQKTALWKPVGTVSDLERVDYFSPVLDCEFDMMKQSMKLKAEYIVWNYGTVEHDFLTSARGMSLGMNILAGNSASATNNHVELFETIRDQVDLRSRKVITPLSYGNPRYRDKVIEKGMLLLGDAFFPVTEFIPNEEYIKMLHSCGFVMMNHLRQQALGNICMAMLMGSKIYLQAKNPLSAWLKARNAHIGSMDSLDLNPLNENQKIFNQKIIQSHWGSDHQKQKTFNLIKTALGEIHD